MKINRLIAGYKRFLANWVGWVSRHAVLTVIFTSLWTLIALIHFVLAVEINTSTTDMLSKDVPFREYAREIDTAFPQTQGTIVVVIEGETAGLANDAAMAMGARLRSMPELFEDVYDLRSEPFFRQNSLLYLEIDELFNLSDDLAEVQPFLGTLSRDHTLVGFFRIISLAVKEGAKNSGDMFVPMAAFFNEIAEVAEAQVRREFKVLDWSRLISGDVVKKVPVSKRRRFILLKPKLDFNSLQPAEEAINQVRASARHLGINKANGLRLRITGSVALEQEELQSVKKGIGLAVLASLVLVLIILLAGLGSIRLVFATLSTLIMGLIWTASFAIVSIGALNIISVAFAVLFIGLGVDFGIHFGLRYREALNSCGENIIALREAAMGAGGPLTLCAVSAGISFFAFLPTDYVGLAELGLIAGSGMFIALFANFTVLPAITSLLPPPVDFKKTKIYGGIGLLAPRAALVTLLVVTLGSIALLPRVDFDFNPLNLKDPNSESVSTLLDLMKDGTRSYYSGELLSTDIASAKKLASTLSTLPEVDHAMTLANFVPKEQGTKLEIISNLALFMASSLYDGPSIKKTSGSIVKTRREWAALEFELDQLIERRPGELAEAAMRMRQVLSKLVLEDKEIELLEKRIFNDLSGRLTELKLALNATAVTLEDLPDQLRRRWLTNDGRALVEIFPKADLGDRRELEAFVSAVRHQSPRLSGTPVTVMEAGRIVLGSFVEAGLIAIVAICILLFAVLRDPINLAFVFAPVFLAGLWTAAVTVLGGLSFNLANVIVLPLLFGLGVAGAIHLVARTRDSESAELAMRTSTPRAVILSALTTIVSFGSISLSSHPGTASMGILLMIAITATVLATLVFLPALMALVFRKQYLEGP